MNKNGDGALSPTKVGAGISGVNLYTSATQSERLAWATNPRGIETMFGRMSSYGIDNTGGFNE